MTPSIDELLDQLRLSLEAQAAKHDESRPERTAACVSLSTLVDAWPDWQSVLDAAHVANCRHCQAMIRGMETRNERFGPLEEIFSDSGRESLAGQIKGGEGSNPSLTKNLLRRKAKKMRNSLFAVGSLVAACLLAMVIVDWLGRSPVVQASPETDLYQRWEQASLPQPYEAVEPAEIVESVAEASIVPSKSELDQQLAAALAKAPELASFETRIVPTPLPGRVTAGPGEIWIDRAHKVSNTRRIDQCVTWADPAGLHLGQIVDANEFIESGVLNPVRGLEPKPMDIVIEGMWPTAMGDTSPLATTMETTDLAGFARATQQLVADRLKVDQKIYFPFRGDFRFEEASSLEQVSVALNVAGSYMGAFESEFKGQAATRSDRQIVYLYFRQPMYRVTLVESSLSGFLNTAPADAEAAVAERHPGYVNSMTYGRVIFAAFKTQSDSKLLKAALRWKASGVVASISGELKASYEQAINQSDMRVFVHGGQAAPKFSKGAEGFDQLLAYLNSTTEFSTQNLPAVIGFEVRDLLTGDLIGRKDVSEYAAFEEPTRSKYRYRLTLVTASIRETHDSFPNGDGDWQVKATTDAEEDVFLFHRTLPNGEHTLHHGSGDKTAPAGQFRLRFDVRETDSFPAGDDDDVTSHEEKIDLLAMAAKLAKIELPTGTPTPEQQMALAKQIEAACRHEFEITTPSTNKFKFLLELLPPTE